MKYVIIPVRSYDEGKEIAEDHFGSMIWDVTEKTVMKAYPYDHYTPVIIKEIEDIKEKVKGE